MFKLARGGYLLSNNAPRNRNFFEINPLFPKSGEGEYKLYGKNRNPISALEYVTKKTRIHVRNDFLIYEALKKRPERAQMQKRFAKRLVIDTEALLPYGLGFDNYIGTLKSIRSARSSAANSSAPVNDRSYIDAVTKIIHSLKLKSEPELVRYFRLALASMKSDQINEKIKGSMLKRMVLEAARTAGDRKGSRKVRSRIRIQAQAANNPVQNVANNNSFQTALKQLDMRIQDTEKVLGIHDRWSLRQINFHPDFDPPHEVKEADRDQQSDINFDRRPIRITGLQNKSKQDYLDDVYKDRISRLYFLKKLQAETYLNEQAKTSASPEDIESVFTELNGLRLTELNNVAQTLAYKYRIESIVPEQSSMDIVREVELFVNSLQVGLKSTNNTQMDNEEPQAFLFKGSQISSKGNINDQQREGKQTVEEKENEDTQFIYHPQVIVTDNSNDLKKEKLTADQIQKMIKSEEISKKDKKLKLPKNPKDMLWANIVADQVFDPELKYSGIQINDNDKQDLNPDLSQRRKPNAISVSPNANVEMSLNSIPFNIYKHSEFEIFGEVIPDFKEINVGVNQFLERIVDPKKGYPKFVFQQEGKRKRRPQIPPESDQVEFYGAGRRKTSKAMCRIRPGTGMVKVNRVNIRDYIADTSLRGEALKPLVLSNTAGLLDVDFFVAGGGHLSQLDAMNLALVKALIKRKPEIKFIFRRAGLVTHDTRLKERKHSGLYKARKAYPYVRR